MLLALKSLQILIFQLRNKLVDNFFPFPIRFRRDSGKKYTDHAFTFYISGKIIHFMGEKEIHIHSKSEVFYSQVVYLDIKVATTEILLQHSKE